MERVRRLETGLNEQRAEEVREFWRGFEGFREGEQVREKRIRGEVITEGEERFGRPLTDEEVERATEVAMICLYSMQVAKELGARVSEGVKLPFLDVAVGEANQVFTFYPPGEELSFLSGIVEASVGYLVKPEVDYSVQVRPWFTETEKTVSRYLPDWVIVDIAMAGAEEYAHTVMTKVKSVEKVAAAVKQQKELDLVVKSLEDRGRFEDAVVVYHLSEYERRGLVWQQALLRHCFPSWAEPTNELVRKVKLLRRTVQDKQREQKRPGDGSRRV